MNNLDVVAAAAPTHDPKPPENTEAIDPRVNEPMLQFFAYSHLRPDLQGVSRAFANLAYDVVANTPRNPERTVALRKLLEAKDCAVRAILYQ